MDLIACLDKLAERVPGDAQAYRWPSRLTQTNTMPAGLDERTAIDVGSIQPAPVGDEGVLHAAPASVLSTLRGLGELIGWWEFASRLVVSAVPRRTPEDSSLGCLLSADLSDGKGCSFSVRQVDGGWAVVKLTRGESVDSVVVTHCRLARKDRNCDFGGKRLKFEVCWKLVELGGSDFPELVPVVSRFAGLEGA